MCIRRAYYKNWQHHPMAKFKAKGGHHRRQFWKEKFNATFNYPPVNVEELDDQYVLHLYAPGLEKEDFLLATIDQTLSISVDKKEEAETMWKRQEFSGKNFKRQFELSDKIDTASISAKYENGVLKVTLPKLEGFETSRQEIQIA